MIVMVYPIICKVIRIGSLLSEPNRLPPVKVIAAPDTILPQNTIIVNK